MRTKRALKRDETGKVVNPLRTAIATRLEKERKRRKLTHKQLVEMIRQGTDDGKFSYNTYIRTRRGQNNITLRTVAHIAATLNISIADFLYGDGKAPKSARQLDEKSIRMQLAKRLEQARKKNGLMRKEFAGRIGIAELTYYTVARGETNVSVDTIAAIASALHQEPVEFLFS